MVVLVMQDIATRTIGSRPHENIWRCDDPALWEPVAVSATVIPLRQRIVENPPPPLADPWQERMRDTEEDRKARVIDRVRKLPPAKLAAVEKLLDDFDGATDETTSRSAKEPPRLKWGKDRDPDETPAHFAARAYAGEIADGTFDKALIRQDDKTLYQRLFRDKAWPALEALIASRVPTKSQRISQRLTELAEHGERPTRSGDIGLYEAERYRSRGAHMKP